MLMYKLAFIILLLVNTALGTSNLAIAGQSIITYEDFVHLNQNQQKETIKLVHQYLITYEKLTPKAKKKDKKKYKTYSKIFNFFIASAYAEELVPTSDAIRDNICFYAGWISFKTRDGKCTHPLNLENNRTRYEIDRLPGDNASAIKDFFRRSKQKYTTATSNNSFTSIVFENGSFSLRPGNRSSCSQKGKVLCNPTIYGHDPRDGSDTKPFCVDGNSNDGLNSSLLCSKARDALSSQSDRDRLDAIILSKAQERAPDNEFFYILRSMYDSCLCAGDRPSSVPEGVELFGGTSDYEFANKMFYHRTCFGIINQTKQITEVLTGNSAMCSVLSNRSLTADDNTESWLDFLSAADRILFDEQNYEQQISNLISSRAGSLARSEENARAQNDLDEREIRDLRRDHMAQYHEIGLCPIGRQTTTPLQPSGDEPAITTAGADTSGDNTGDTQIGTTGQGEEAQLEREPGADGEETQQAREENEDFTLVAEVNDKSTCDGATKSIVKITLTAADDATIPNPGDDLITLDGGTKVESAAGTPCEESTTTGDDAPAAGDDTEDDGDDAQDTPQDDDQGAGEDAQDTAQDDDQGAGEDAQDTAQDDEQNDNTLVTYYEVNKQEDLQALEAIATIENNEYKTTVNIPALNSDNEGSDTSPGVGTDDSDDESDETPSLACSVSLSPTDSGRGLRLSYNFNGKTYPGEEGGIPADYDVKIKWYDSALGSPSGEEVSTSTAGTLDSISSGDDDEADESEDDEAITLIREQLNENTEVQNDLVDNYDFSPSAQTRIVAVTLEISKDGNMVCSSADSQSKAGQAQRAANDKPVTVPGAVRMQKSQGQVLGGAR